LVDILFNRSGTNENKFNSRHTHIINKLVDEMTIITDKIKIPNIMTLFPS